MQVGGGRPRHLDLSARAAYRDEPRTMTISFHCDVNFPGEPGPSVPGTREARARTETDAVVLLPHNHVVRPGCDLALQPKRSAQAAQHAGRAFARGHQRPRVPPAAGTRAPAGPGLVPARPGTVRRRCALNCPGPWATHWGLPGACQPQASLQSGHLHLGCSATPPCRRGHARGRRPGALGHHRRRPGAEGGAGV